MLRPTGVVVNDIVDDIGSGVLLCKLAMLLTMKKIKYQRNPKMVFQVGDYLIIYFNKLIDQLSMFLMINEPSVVTRILVLC